MSSNSTSTSTTIKPTSCVYGCDTRIYWNNSINEYWEVFTQKKHICTKRLSNNNKSALVMPTNNNTERKSTNYNYKKSWTPKFNNKQPMDNSLEILHGSTNSIGKQYETLSDLIKKYNGKTHGSQSHVLSNNSIQIIVYYEVPEGMRDVLKRTYDNLIRELKEHSNGS